MERIVEAAEALAAETGALVGEAATLLPEDGACRLDHLFSIAFTAALGRVGVACRVAHQPTAAAKAWTETPDNLGVQEFGGVRTPGGSPGLQNR